jgi:hypothetical protein
MMRKHAFLVSLWVESVEADASESGWRGSIEHLSTRRRRYFRDMTELVRFLADWTGRREGE